MPERILVALLLCGVLANIALSQAEERSLNTFGYFQATAEEVAANRWTKEHSSFGVQQANLMFEKGFTGDLSAFVNIAFSNTFSSSRNWGELALEDAWLRYHAGSALNVKAGLLVPIFNNLNEIKDKTPLLPYIVRPGVYERAVSDLLQITDYVPQQAFLQCYGFVPLDAVKLDYALYMGNSEPAFVNGLAGNFQVRGADTTSYKLLGARIGIRTKGLKLGISSTTDKSNRGAIGLGPVQRFRLGCDASCQIGGFSLEAELIDVIHNLTPVQKATLAQISSLSPMVGSSLAEFFSYAVLAYDCSEKTFVYVGHNYVIDKSRPYLAAGFNLYTAGAGLRMSDEIVLKAQYLRYDLADTLLATVKQDHYLLGLSVMF